MHDFSCGDFEIIDAHCHIFPEKISEKAAANIGAFYDLPMNNSGSSKLLIKAGKTIGVTKYLVCSTATVKEQTYSINNFIRSECDEHPEFFGFGTLHPQMPDIQQEAQRISELGLHGVKLHPDFQQFNIDSPEAYKIYEVIEGNLPVLVHMGDPRYDYSRPFRLANVIRDFPKLEIIAAHLGGYQRWDEAIECLKGSEYVHFDTCSAAGIIPPDYSKKLIYHYGVENCFFGTDFPMWNHQKELNAFFNIGLKYDECKKILSENFKTFFNIS